MKKEVLAAVQKQNPKLAKAVKKHRKQEETAAKLFSVEEFLTDAAKIREVYVKEINRIVKYQKLCVVESRELTKIVNADERAQKMLYLMLHKADPSITEENIGKLSSDVAAAILTAVLKDQVFLQGPTR